MRGAWQFNFIRMMFAPIADRGAYRHETRIGLFVIDEFAFAGAGNPQFVGDEFGKGRSQSLFVVTGAKTIAEPDRPAADASLERIEMRGDRAFDQSEMRQVEFRRIQRPDFRDRFLPGFNVQLRRHEWRNRGPFAQTHTSNVAAKDVVVPVINMMMTGVAGGRDRANFEWRDADKVIVLQNSNAFRGHRGDFSPEPFHLVAIKASGGSDKLCGIDQVRCAARVHVNRRAKLRETPRGAGMIEMDVT